MVSEVEVEVLSIQVTPEVPFRLSINNTELLPFQTFFLSSSLIVQLEILEEQKEIQIDLLPSVSKYEIPVSTSNYNGSIELILSLSPVLESENFDWSSNCRYLNNIKSSEAYNENTKKILFHLEEMMGSNYQKLLEDAVRPPSPARSPLKKNSKPGNKTPAKTPSKSPYKRSFSGLSFDQGGVVEIPSSNDIFLEKVSGKDSHCLMLLVAALLAKRRLLKNKDDEDEIIKNIILNNDKAAEVMQAAFEETKIQIKNEKDDILLNIKNSTGEVFELENKLKGLQETNFELITKKEQLLKNLETSIEDHEILKKIPTENVKELIQEIQNFRNLTEESENERKSIQENYSEFLASFKAEMIEKDREINKSQDFLNKSITELNQKDVYLTHLIQDNTKLQGQILGITSELITNLSHNDRVEILQSLINEDINSVTSLKSKLAKALEFYSAICVESEKALENIKESKETIEKEQENTKVLIETESETFETLSNILKGVKESLVQMKNLYNTTGLIEQNFAALKKRLVFSYDHKEHALKELKYLSDVILHLTSCYTSAHRSFVKASNLLDQKNCEVITIHEALTELKKNYPVYFPLKEDPLDFALGNYLNSRDLGLSVPFIREGGGVYVFGTRKILINYERNKLTVKVGGGFLPIEEFINAYSDIELEKFIAKCKELSPKAKKFLGKWVGGLVENCEDSKKIKEKIIHAAEEHKYSISYAIVSPERSPSPIRKSRTSFN